MGKTNDPIRSEIYNFLKHTTNKAAFFDFFEKENKSISISKKLEYLSVSATLGETLGHRYAYNDADTKRYLDLLNNFLQKDPTCANQIFKLLQIADHGGITVGYAIAMERGPTLTCQYLKLLQELLAKGIDAKELYTMLMQKPRLIQPDEHFAFSHCVATQPGENSTRQFIELLNDMYAKLSQYYLNTVVTYVPNHNDRVCKLGSFSDIVRKTKDTGTNFLLLNSDILSTNQIKKFKKMKGDILNYIFNLTGNEKKMALQNALDKNHTLGAFIWPKFRFRKAKMSDFPLNLFQDILDGMRTQSEPAENRSEIVSQSLTSLSTTASVTKEFAVRGTPSTIYPETIFSPHISRMNEPFEPDISVRIAPYDDIPPKLKTMPNIEETNLIDLSIEPIPVSAYKPF